MNTKERSNGSVRVAPILIAALVLVTETTLLTNADESVEPPLIVEVQVGEAILTVPLGKSGKIKIGEDTLDVTLTPRPSRTLKLTNVSFDYPRQFAFEYNTSAAPLETWTLKGIHTRVMVHRYPAAMGDLTEAYSKKAVGQYTGWRVKTADVELKLPGRRLSGKQVTAALKNRYALSAEILGWKTKRYGVVLILQDTLDDAGDHSKEYDEFLGILRTTFAE